MQELSILLGHDCSMGQLILIVSYRHLSTLTNLPKPTYTVTNKSLLTTVHAPGTSSRTIMMASDSCQLLNAPADLQGWSPRRAGHLAYRTSTVSYLAKDYLQIISKQITGNLTLLPVCNLK